MRERGHAPSIEAPARGGKDAPRQGGCGTSARTLPHRRSRASSGQSGPVDERAVERGRLLRVSGSGVADRSSVSYGDEIPRPLHRLSVAQYDAMGRAGILGPNDRVELLDGLLVEKMTKKPPRRIATRCAREALARLVPDGWYVDSQEPIVTESSEPEPDVAVIRGSTRDYVNANPPASAVALVVEVADASLARDRALKAAIYARAGIPVYWIIDLVERQVEVLSAPERASDGKSGSYGARRTATDGETIAIVVDGRDVGSLEVSDLLP